MKLYGYYSKEQKGAVELQEATIVATPEELKYIADFFAKAAKELEEKDDGAHLHYQDFKNPGDYQLPDLIAYKE